MLFLLYFLTEQLDPIILYRQHTEQTLRIKNKKNMQFVTISQKHIDMTCFMFKHERASALLKAEI